jgi:ATP adenylyltransferase
MSVALFFLCYKDGNTTPIIFMAKKKTKERASKKPIARVDITNSGFQERGNYTDVLKKITKDGDCPFCEKNILLNHTKPILFKNKSWVVTTNAWPYEGTKHHFLLIVRRHIERAEDATPEEWNQLGDAYKKLCTDFKIKGATLGMRSGDTKYTGASVRHLHAQIIVGSARKENSKTLNLLAGFYTSKKK